MAIERYNPSMPQIDRDYFSAYTRLLLPFCRGKVLDLGCGEGWMTKLIAQQEGVSEVTAIDKFNDQPEENKDPKITYRQSNIPLKLDSYDTINSTEFIEHITQEDLEILLDNLKLNDGGMFIGSTPDRLSPTTNPFHLKEYTKEELKELFAKHGLQGEFINPIVGLTVWKVKFQS